MGNSHFGMLNHPHRLDLFRKRILHLSWQKTTGRLIGLTDSLRQVAARITICRPTEKTENALKSNRVRISATFTKFEHPAALNPSTKFTASECIVCIYFE
jgi:hypothetical protein